jgi:putative phosphoribosyl transferase
VHFRVASPQNKVNIMFKDRKDAAGKLALALHQYQHQNVLVLGIPNAGIEMAYYLAQDLRGEMSFVITRELNYPTNPNSCFGAIAEDGSEYVSTAARKHLSMEEIEDMVEVERHAIQRRIKALRGDTEFPSIYRKTVIITDDGSASMATIVTAVDLCRNHFADKVIVALPVGNEREGQILMEKADEVIILEKLHFYTVVEESYESYTKLADEGALYFLNKWEEEKHAHNV